LPVDNKAELDYPKVIRQFNFNNRTGIHQSREWKRSEKQPQVFPFQRLKFLCLKNQAPVVLQPPKSDFDDENN
jgi:hypothetical protein